MPRWACLDGNEAVARVAHPLSEVIAIYPITPASPMGELADVWRAYVEAQLVDVRRMQAHLDEMP